MEIQCYFFHLVKVHYWDWEYKTANIVLFSIKHVADILYVSRLIR